MIKVENLGKSFGPKRAVEDVSFEVGKGEVLGFLGPNGAGKSTTMRMITGFIPPSTGAISVCGIDVLEDPLEVKRRIGYLPEAAPSYADMSVLSFLRFAAEIRGLRGESQRGAVRRVVELCHLEHVLGQTIETLSKGFRHRTCLAQALIHDPEVLILDEPTDGLDPNQKHEVRTLIRRMGESKAIIFSTHILEEVEAACTRAIIIDRGKIVANGTPGELRAMSDIAGAVTLHASGADADAMAGKLASLEGVARVACVDTADVSPGALRAFPRDKSAVGTLARAVVELAAREGWKLDQVRTEEGQLDEVFRRITLPDTVKERR